MLGITDNYPMSSLTTLQIGGPAKKFVIVKTQQDLEEAIQLAKQNNLSYLIIGSGSNLLVADEGVNCLIIKNEIIGISTWEELASRSRSKPSSRVSVKSGTPLQQLVDYTVTRGLSGLQKLTGIPGTVGGAVFGNAGAYGQTISDHLAKVAVIHSSSLRGASNNEQRGPLRRLPSRRGRSEADSEARFAARRASNLLKEECNFSYRDSIFKKTHDIILEVTFLFNPDDPKTLQKEAQEVLSKRLIKYPPGIKCPGSFFKNLIAAKLPLEILKNIPKDKIIYGKLPAGALLEEVGAKGDTMDGIYITDYHANLFVNQGQGTALAFYNLAKKYALKVKEKYGISLEPEVQLVNLPPLINA